MEQFDDTKIAKLTGRAAQDDETFKAEGGFVPKRDQFYFELQQSKDGTTFLIGLEDILKCLRLMEEIGELPEIGGKWWSQINSLYGYDVSMVKYAEKNC